MFKTKYLASILLVLAVLFAQVGSVLAAPAAQDTTPIAGTIQNITLETDTEGVTTVLVTVLDDQGGTQTGHGRCNHGRSCGRSDKDRSTCVHRSDHSYRR
jgi:hypothetical protein